MSDMQPTGSPSFHQMRQVERGQLDSQFRHGATTIAIAIQAMALAEQAAADSPRRSAWACTKGCSWCCHQHVSITPPEALVIALFLLRHQQVGLDARIARITRQAAAAAAAGTSVAYSRQRIRCAFLDDDGACSIYMFRPVMCRGFASFELQSCKDWHAHSDVKRIATDEDSIFAAAGVVTAVMDAAKAMGFDGRAYELHSSVLRALSLPLDAEAWQTGQRPFEGCLPELPWDVPTPP